MTIKMDIMGTTDKAVRDALYERAIDPETGGRNNVKWDEVLDGLPVKYSRAWLIVERRIMELTAPQLIIDLDAARRQALEQWVASGKAEGDFNVLPVYAEVARRLRQEENISWGEISVRMGIPESRVRGLFRQNGLLRDKGLRIGKGGRWVLDDPVLYQEHRVKEGAAIANETKLSEVRGNPDALVNGTEPLRQRVTVAQLIKGGVSWQEFEANRTKRINNMQAKRAAKKAAPKELTA